MRCILLLIMACAPALAQPEVAVVADLLELFSNAAVTNTSSTEVRRPASAGGAKQDALFEHPAAPGTPARAEFRVRLPSIGTSELLLFAFEIAIADGVKQGSGEDGVGFGIEVDGQGVFSASTKETRWQPRAVDLTKYAGNEVRLALLTEARANTTYDWAVWGSPRILRFSSLNERSSHTNITSGALAVFSQTNAQFRLTPVGQGTSLEIPLSPGWVVTDFSFPAAERIEWSPQHGKVMIAKYAPDLRITRFGPDQALVTAGEPFGLGVELRNAGRGFLNDAELQGEFAGSDLPALKLPRVAPGESLVRSWKVRAPEQAGAAKASVRSGTNLVERDIDIFTRGPETTSVENGFVKITFIKEPTGYGAARIFAKHERDWVEAATWTPLWKFDSWDARALNHSRSSRSSIEFSQAALDPGGIEWKLKLRVTLEENRPLARVFYSWEPVRPAKLKIAWGPNIYVGEGEGTTGAAKTWGLCPGLEYLYGAEPSSNVRDFAPNLADRRSPHPHKITIPLMAVTIGPDSHVLAEKVDRFFTPDSLKDWRPPAATFPSMRTNVTVALAWKGPPKARFASPNFDEGMANHRIGLFFESTEAKELESTLIVTRGPVLSAVREWLKDNGGLPRPNPWPRSFQEELDICREGFLETVWDAGSQKWRHCIGWGVSHAPGFAALLWWDAQLAARPEARKVSRERVELVATHMLRDGGPGLFASQAACHIMQWEFPFLYGHLPEALGAAEELVGQLIKTQPPEGGWLYEAANKEQADLGRAGDSVLGTSANRAATILRFARITGDRAALAAGEKALHFMEQFRVPRGGQTWECPMYEPDILAAAYAVRAYHDAYRATGNSRWLHNAVYWAETGVPFQYLWTLPDKPMMLGASIPVFGSTFYTHSWLGVPVQWCGLVYAYHIWHLADELERAIPAARGSPLPLSLGFAAKDWRRMTELITVSAMHQQFTDEEKIGAYPDSITDFEKRNPAFLNPEDILVNVLAISGNDPDVKTVWVKDLVISSGAKIRNVRERAGKVRFELDWFVGERSQTLIAGIKPRSVSVNGEALLRSDTPLKREPGWWWDAKRERLFLTVGHNAPRVDVEITLAN